MPRHRKARDDQKISRLKSTIAITFGIPRESLRIVSPSGRAFNAAGKVGAVRRKWAKHLTR